ncbi:MAG: OmpA family protein [Rhodospirillales bacterium]|nr:OmpA family protein [Rhodospirillales bacterium]
MTRIRKLVSAAIPLGALLLLGACTSVPDAANPAHWYRSTVDYFSGDDAEAEKKKQEAEKRKQREQRAQAQAQASAQAAPAQPSRGSETGEVAERLARPAGRGLLADTEGGRPRYAAAIPRQSEDPGAPASRAAPAEPPPASAPRAPVSAAAPSAPASQPVAAPPPRPAREIAQAPAPRPQPQPPAPAAQPPTAVSAPPPPSPPPPPPPAARPTSVEETYRASLVQQTQLPSAGAAGLPDDPGTLIISSAGIETPRRAARPGATPAAPPTASAAGVGGSVLGAAIRPAGSVEGAASRATRVAVIQFADGSARLDADARQVLGQVAKLQSEKGGTLRVVGHASMRTKPMDPDRHAKVNEGISIARANAVAQQLARLGVKREAIVVSARGDADPAYYEVMETGEAANRRAEIYIELQP